MQAIIAMGEFLMEVESPAWLYIIESTDIILTLELDDIIRDKEVVTDIDIFKAKNSCFEELIQLTR